MAIDINTDRNISLTETLDLTTSPLIDIDLASSEVVFKGWFEKIGGSYVSNWQRRFFVLKKDKTFFYFKDAECTKLKGQGSLGNCSQVKQTHDEHDTVQFTTPERTWQFRFDNSKQKSYWCEVVSDMEEISDTFIEKEPFVLAVVGAGGVGKSSLVGRYVIRNFEWSENYAPTIEDIYTLDKVVDNVSSRLTITDTAGQEELIGMTDMGIREANAMMIVFALNDRVTWEQLPEFYDRVRSIKESDKETVSVPIVVVGNKSDLEANVTQDEIDATLQEYTIPYFETSAKHNVNVEAPFNHLVRELRIVFESGNELTTDKDGCLIM